MRQWNNGLTIITGMAKQYRHIEQSFDPVFDEHSRVLVLGSFPSELSRANGFYYGNPRNRFWELIASIFGAPLPCSTDEKRALLTANGIALWDVIESCDIKGSSDASIKNVVPADLMSVLSQTHIESVICNGATSGRLYKRYLQYLCGLEPTVLPSTSPANAAWSLERLQERWGKELHDCKPRSAAELKELKETGRYEYAAVRLDAPRASSFAVHKSMQGNKHKDTKPELLVREQLRACGLTGYRLQWKIPGRPDIAWPGKKIALFINGCFWHRCPHCNPSAPKKNVEYWQKKFQGNVERDQRNLAVLQDAGWKTHVIWECELKKNKREETFAQLMPLLAKELGKTLDA